MLAVRSIMRFILKRCHVSLHCTTEKIPVLNQTKLDFFFFPPVPALQV